MTSSTLLLGLGAVCLALLVLVLFAGPLRAFSRFLRNALLGAFGFFAANALFGTAVGVNLLTVGFVGILGLPGFFSLFLIQAIL